MNNRKPILQGLRCRKCGNPFRRTLLLPETVEDFVSGMMNVRCPHCDADSKSISLGENLTIREDRSRRQPGGSVEQRAANWVQQGETGSSSMSIHDHMTNTGRETEHVAPCDLADLRRCVLLMQHVPEWLERMDEMAVHAAWTRLAPRFAEACAAYLADSPDLDGTSRGAGRILESCLERGN